MILKISTQKTTRGFSLVELLLTLVLILCLAAASVFSYTALHRTANLDEGVNRLQSLIRFAQAEAATSGRKIQLQFAPAVSDSAAADAGLRTIKVMWEPDMLTAPGVFLEHTNKAWSEDLVNELVAVEKVKPINNAPVSDPSSFDPAFEPAPVEEPDPFGNPGEELAAAFNAFPAITFYPDGTCDSAEIILASRNNDDQRRLAVRLSGILGSVSSKPVAADGGELLDSSEELDGPSSGFENSAVEQESEPASFSMN